MKASGEVEHERVGEVYTTLVGLLKAKSEHFATTIGKQVCQEWLYNEYLEDSKWSQWHVTWLHVFQLGDQDVITPHTLVLDFS